jgi:hypothetical protein
LGIVEDVYRSEKANEIARSVGKRTVYSFSDIQKLCYKPVLAVNFRLVHFFEPPIALSILLKESILKGPPRTITKISKESAKWIEKEMAI